MTTQTQTLADFLLARIAEDQNRTLDGINNAAGPSDWRDARIFADIQAKRRILRLHQPFQTGPIVVCLTCEERGQIGDEPGVVDWPCETLRALTIPYAAHPDFREEWRP